MMEFIGCQQPARRKSNVRITDVRIRMIQNGESKLKATCSVVIDDAFVVHDLRVVQGANGIFVAMPQRKLGDGQYRDLAHPITAGAREYVQRCVLAAYYKAGVAELGQSAVPEEIQAEAVPPAGHQASQQETLRASLQEDSCGSIQQPHHEGIQETLPGETQPELPEPAPVPAIA